MSDSSYRFLSLHLELWYGAHFNISGDHCYLTQNSIS